MAAGLERTASASLSSDSPSRAGPLQPAPDGASASSLAVIALINAATVLHCADPACMQGRLVLVM
jgi:hypothetical protein